MVLFQNINVGQRVEVKINNLIFRGVVKYKGSVVNKQGDWVGVALDRAGTMVLTVTTGVTFSPLGFYVIFFSFVWVKTTDCILTLNIS